METWVEQTVLYTLWIAALFEYLNIAYLTPKPVTVTA